MRFLGATCVFALAVGGLAACGQSSAPRRVHLRSVWGNPAGGQHPRALLLLIHGGGWEGQSAGGVESEAAVGRIYQRLGYETLAIDYRRGAQGTQDAQMFYRLARKRVGPKLPICALGASAGGHISLVLATRIPELACVIDYAGPTDLVSLARQPGGSSAYQLAVNAFGTSQLATYSPALHASSIRARVMLLFAQTDPIVPAAQGREMARALPGAQLIVLPPGPVGFVHSGVAAGPYESSLAAQERFLAGVARTWQAR